MKTLIFSLFLVSCSSTKCPDEAVSTCRAQRECGSHSPFTYIGMVLSGMGSGINHQRNQASDQYNSCVSNNLSAQRANAGIKDNTTNCVSRVVANDQIETECH